MFDKEVRSHPNPTGNGWVRFKPDRLRCAISDSDKLTFAKIANRFGPMTVKRETAVPDPPKFLMIVLQVYSQPCDNPSVLSNSHQLWEKRGLECSEHG